jgi:hypothetical protein
VWAFSRYSFRDIRLGKLEDRRIPIEAVFVFMIKFGADNRPTFVSVIENSPENLIRRRRCKMSNSPRSIGLSVLRFIARPWHILCYSFFPRWKGGSFMKLSNRLGASGFLSVLFAGIISLSGCVPVETVQRPSLNEVRSGKVRGSLAEDTRLQPGEISAEIDQIDPARRELRVVADDGRRDVLRYDINRTRVIYHGRDYIVDDLEAGDRIAYGTPPRNGALVETIRVQEPVQARSGPSVARRTTTPPRPRTDVVEGTVDRVDYNLGVFEVRPSNGRMVTVSVPYNARATDVDNFRALRRGDPVRVEGEFVNPDRLQLLSFLSPRN